MFSRPADYRGARRTVLGTGCPTCWAVRRRARVATTRRPGLRVRLLSDSLNTSATSDRRCWKRRDSYVSARKKRSEGRRCAERQLDEFKSHVRGAVDGERVIEPGEVYFCLDKHHPVLVWERSEDCLGRRRARVSIPKAAVETAPRGRAGLVREQARGIPPDCSSFTGVDCWFRNSRRHWRRVRCAAIARRRQKGS